MVVFTNIKTVLVRHQKFIVRRRYLIEIDVHQVSGTDRYPDGLKWGLVCVDRVSGRKVLMDNHHPKGPHIHIDDTELPYDFIDLTGS